MANFRYKPSGKVPFPGVLWMLFGGFAGSAVLLSAYIYGLGWMKNAGLRLIVLVLLLFLLGKWMMFLARSGKFRSPAAAFWLSFIAVLAGCYIHWGVYAVYVQDVWQYGRAGFLTHNLSLDTLRRIGVLLLDPLRLLRTLGGIGEIGFWSVRGIRMAGIPLFVCWAVEMLLVLLIPACRAAAQSRRLYSEAQRQWLDGKTEFTVSYIRDHRTMRRHFIEGENSGLDALHYYRRRGREAYGTVVFYHHKGVLGPFISLHMIKAVQTGPHSMKHYFIPVLNEWEIGQANAEDLYDRLDGEMQEQKEEGKNRRKKKRRRAAGLREQLSVSMRRAVSGFSSKRNPQDERYEGDEVTEIEEVTVYVPSITPEMERQFRERKAKEEQERIWAENKEEVRKRRKRNKNKRRSTRIK